MLCFGATDPIEHPPLRLRGIDTREAANAFAPHFMADFNGRFAKAPLRDFDAHRFGPAGVPVNAIAPGPTDTPFLRAHLAKVAADIDQAVAAAVSVMPLGHLISTDDFADAAVFLASAASRSISGHTLVLDAGASAGRM